MRKTNVTELKKYKKKDTSSALDRNVSTPLYAQLDEIIRSNIENNYWQPGQRIPSENELCKIHALSRMTVRSVISQLVWDGLLYRVQGKGTFVSQPKILTHPPAYMGIREQLESQGYATSTALHSFEVVEPKTQVLNALGIEKNTRVYMIVRIRSIQGEPVSIHTSYIPCNLAPMLQSFNAVEDQLCTILSREYNLLTSVCNETLEVTSASESDAQMLKVKRGYPLLLLEEINQTNGNVIFEYTKIKFRSDKIRIRMNFSNLDR